MKNVNMLNNQYIDLPVVQALGGVPLSPPDPLYSVPTWTFVNGTIALITDLIGGGKRINANGQTGVLVGTATATKPGAPNITDQVQVTITGPEPDGLLITPGIPVNQ